MRVGFPLLAATLVLPGLADSLVTLFLALFVLGLASGALDVAMNAQGIEVERAPRPPDPVRAARALERGPGHRRRAGRAGGGDRCRPARALRGRGGGAGGGLARVPARAARGAAPGGGRAGRRSTCSVRWTLALVLLGVIAFCSFVGEGAASDWSAVYMTQELGASRGAGSGGLRRVRGHDGDRTLRGRPAARPARQRRARARRLADRGGRPRPRPAGARAGCRHSGIRAARPRASRRWYRSRSARPATSTLAPPAAWWAEWRRSATSARWPARS